MSAFSLTGQIYSPINRPEIYRWQLLRDYWGKRRGQKYAAAHFIRRFRAKHRQCYHDGGHPHECAAAGTTLNSAAYTVMDTVIMGNRRLYERCGCEKDALYAKEDFSDAGPASALPSWRANLPSLAAGRLKPKRRSCCRALASRWRSTRWKCPQWTAAAR